MMNYARLDTHYLIPLRYRLKSELVSKKRWPVAEEDFDRLRYVNGRDPHDQPEPCWRVRGAYDLDPQQAAVLLELCRYRTQVAKSINRPVFKVISDKSLLAIAETCPRSTKELQNMSALSKKQFHRHGEGLLKAVKSGLGANPVYPPRSPKPDEQYLARMDALRSWRKKTARGVQVKSDVILPRDVMYEIVARDPNSRQELAEIMQQVPWRFDKYADQILATLSDL
jgi:ribonuclease D